MDRELTFGEMAISRPRQFIFHREVSPVRVICEDLDVLKQLVGVKLKKLLGYKYPSVSGYETLILLFDNGIILSIKLRSHSIQFKFEVFVVHLSVLNEITENWSHSTDEIQFHDFEIAAIDVIRRLEWTELGSTESEAMTRSSNEKTKSAKLTSELARSESVQVDVGLAIASLSGEKLVCEAGSFPLVFQFEYQTKPDSFIREYERLVG